MYFRDEHGQVWLKEGDEFRNIGIRVREKPVTFKRLDSVHIVLGSVKVGSLDNPIPVTVRDVVRQLGITENKPLCPLNGKEE